MVLALAGCGNAKHDFRVDKLEPLVRQLSQQQATLATVLRISRPHRPRDAAVLRSQVDQVGASMRRIARLHAPDGTETRFRRYTGANAAVLASLRGYVDAFARGDAAQQRGAAQRVQAAVAQANRARQELQDALG